MERTSLSVIVPVLNRPDLLWRFYSGLPKQSGIHELIFVDNGSDAATKAMLERIKSGDSAVSVVTNEANLGFAKANNQGYAASVGSVVCFTQTDVEVRDDLGGIAPTLQSDILYGPDHIGYNTGWNTFGPVIFPYLVGWMVLCTRPTWERLGGWDERYFPADMEDIDLSTTALVRGIKLARLGLHSVHEHAGQGGWSQLPGRMEVTIRNKQKFKEKWT